MSLSEIFQDLEDQLEDLQRNTKFCLNSYDYHHKNNEYEILQSLQEILKESFHDGREYQQIAENVRESIKRAREMCQQADQKLNKLDISRTNDGKSEEANGEGSKGNYSSTGQSVSFKDEPHSDQSFEADQGDDNKENIY